jgi:hypothetical protein
VGLGREASEAGDVVCRRPGLNYMSLCEGHTTLWDQ